MGRGLSDLQKTILLVAYRNRVAEGPTSNPDAYSFEVLTAYFGWKPTWERIDGDRHKYSNSQRFDMARIGEKRYVAARAALSRAVRRLESRGLVDWYVGHWIKLSGVKLTPLGIQVATRLSVNEVTRCQRVNR